MQRVSLRAFVQSSLSSVLPQKRHPGLFEELTELWQFHDRMYRAALLHIQEYRLELHAWPSCGEFCIMLLDRSDDPEQIGWNYIIQLQHLNPEMKRFTIVQLVRQHVKELHG